MSTYTKTEVIVGGAVLAGITAFGVYASQFTGMSQTRTGYELGASFRSLEGVGIGSDVRLAGVKIGTVTDITLNSDTYRADTRFIVADGIPVPDDSAIVISSEGLLGGNFVEIIPGGSPFYFEAGDQIEDTQGAVSLISLLVKFVTGSGKTGKGSE